MPNRIRISRLLSLPDPIRVARCSRAPELGPRIVFLSGGTALRPLSRVLKEYTHNSIHLITPFDSGGSSASLRQTFDMLSIGDLRNRLVALADESTRGNPEIYRLFCHRLPVVATDSELREELQDMISGVHELVAAVPEPMRQITKTHLALFRDRAPAAFDLHGANIGNLMLTGGYLAHDRSIESALFLFSKLLEVRGIVEPTADTTAHLGARLADGTEVYGQHLMTGKQVPPLTRPVTELFLVDRLVDPRPVRVSAEPRVLKLIRNADLICYPMGSFFTSVLASLLPSGIGRAIAEAGCPKVFIPNMGHDPEQLGTSVAGTVTQLLDVLRRDAGPDTNPARLLNAVVVDSQRGNYESPLDLDPIERLGVSVIDVDLVGATSSKPGISPQPLSEILLTLGQ